jgi:hypothetical protein
MSVIEIYQIGGDLQEIARKLTDTQATINEIKDQMAQMESIPPSVESTLMMLNRRHAELDAAYTTAAQKEINGKAT